MSGGGKRYRPTNILSNEYPARYPARHLARYLARYPLNTSPDTPTHSSPTHSFFHHPINHPPQPSSLPRYPTMPRKSRIPRTTNYFPCILIVNFPTGLSYLKKNPYLCPRYPEPPEIQKSRNPDVPYLPHTPQAG